MKAACNRCSARSSRTGQPCQRWAINGGTVCATHGGRAPAAKRKAAERLADLIDPDRALREAARIAYFDIRTLFDASGNLRPIAEWPDEAAAVVGGFEVHKRNLEAGDGKIDTLHKVKVIDKTAALTLLFKHSGLLIDKVEHAGTIELTWKGDED